MILAWECSWFDFAILTYGEAMKPTFGKRASRDDIKMLADDYCLYHCFNYAKSNGASPLTVTYAKRLREKIVWAMRRDKLSEAVGRLVKGGAEGYPDEEDFKYFAKVAGFSFAIVQAPIREPLVYGSELGPVRLTVRLHKVADGAGHLSDHYDVISYEAPTIISFEELNAPN